jgi:hypothetical protein
VGNPVGRSAAATEGGLEAAMKTFKDTVGLWRIEEKDQRK